MTLAVLAAFAAGLAVGAWAGWEQGRGELYKRVLEYRMAVDSVGRLCR